MAWSSCLAWDTNRFSKSSLENLHTCCKSRCKLISRSSRRIVSNYLIRLLVLRINFVIISRKKAYPNICEHLFRSRARPHKVTSVLPQGLGHPCPRLRGLRSITTYCSLETTHVCHCVSCNGKCGRVKCVEVKKGLLFHSRFSNYQL